MRRRRNNVSSGLEELGLLEFAKFEQILSHRPTVNDQTTTNCWVDPREQLGDLRLNFVGLR
jgi:hypothetical protein